MIGSFSKVQNVFVEADREWMSLRFITETWQHDIGKGKWTSMLNVHIILYKLPISEGEIGFSWSDVRLVSVC